MCYAIAPSPRCLVRPALPTVPEYCPGQQIDGRVPVPTLQHEEIPGITWAGEVG